MNCCITDLRNKEVICAKTGCRLGCVSDVEIDTCSGCLVAIVVWVVFNYPSTKHLDHCF